MAGGVQLKFWQLAVVVACVFAIAFFTVAILQVTGGWQVSIGYNGTG